MKYTTTRFGVIEFPEDVVLTFPDGILGFPAEKRYILLEHNTEGSPFKWLQCLDNPDLAFIVVDPFLIDPSYHYQIDLDTARLIETDEPTLCAVMSIVNVPTDNPIQMTANLKAPLVVNANNRYGRQIILGSNAFAISTPVFPSINDTLQDGSPDHHGAAAPQRAAS